jgi:lipopolysaccharide transport protein LptA
MLVVAVWLAFGAAAWAQNPTNTVIVADTMNFDYRRMIAVFEGNVDVTDPQIRMLSDKLTVMFESTNSVRSVTAVGNVRIYHANRQATCDQAVYVARSSEIEMNGNARLFWEKDRVFGKKIVFWLDKDQMRVESPTLVIEPEGDRKPLDLSRPGAPRAGGGGSAGGGRRP